MKFTRTQYSLKSFDPSRLPFAVQKLREYFVSWKMEGYFGYDSHNKLADGDFLSAVSAESFSEHRTVGMVFSKEQIELTVGIYSDGDLLVIATGSKPDGNINHTDLQDLLRAQLRLQEPSQEESESTPNLYDINRRVVRILKRVEDWGISNRAKPGFSGKNCFLSFSFDEHGMALAFELRDFFELLGVGFVSGLGYEPRPISEKVLSRLNEPISLFVVLFTRSENQDWLQQEIGIAKGRNLPVMVLIEDGVDFKSGILSDNEFFKFPKNTISKSFIAVLQALKYVSNKNTA